MEVERLKRLIPTTLHQSGGQVAELFADPVCEHCNGRGVIETGKMENGPGGWGYVTVDCECETGERV